MPILLRRKIVNIGIEAVVGHNLCFLHAAFGFQGTLNDINIWEHLSLFESMTSGEHERIDFDFIAAKLFFQNSLSWWWFFSSCHQDLVISHWADWLQFCNWGGNEEGCWMNIWNLEDKLSCINSCNSLASHRWHLLAFLCLHFTSLHDCCIMYWEQWERSASINNVICSDDDASGSKEDLE